MRKKILGMILAALVIVTSYQGWRVGRLAVSVRARLERLQSFDPTRLTLDSLLPLIEDTHAARAELHALQAELTPFLPICPYLGWLPVYGAEVESWPALLEVAVELADAGDVLLMSVEPRLESFGQGKLSFDQVIQLVRDIQPAVQQARAHLERAAQARARITRPLSPRVAGWLARADKLLPLAMTAVDAAALAPAVLGLDGQRTFLVLAQNSDELRPTGGFVSGVGRVVIEQGRIISQTFQDSYAVDDYRFPYPDPPPELLMYMGAEIWTLRDSNWSPDFPTSARQAVRLYQISRAEQIDGVIAVNLQAIPRLFEGLGPMTVAGFDQPVTAKNAMTLMRQQVLPPPEERVDGQWWSHRKDFTAVLADAVLARLQAGLQADQALGLARAIFEALERRDVLIYIESPQAQHLLARRKWDGALWHAPGDFLMVVDTNVGFNKVNPNIDEEIAYSVQLDRAGSGRARLTVTHTSRARPELPCNPAPRYDATYEGAMNRCYWDYLRVYAPAGSQLISATLQSPAPLVGNRLSDGRPVSGGELGYAFFASFFALNGGARQVTHFAYTLPQVVRADNDARLYSLYVQRQPASGDWPLVVSVTLPPGARVARTDPPASGDAQTVRWSLRLSADQVVRVWYRVSHGDTQAQRGTRHCSAQTFFIAEHAESAKAVEKHWQERQLAQKTVPSLRSPRPLQRVPPYP